MKEAKKTARVKELIEGGRLIQGAMDRSLSPCSSGGTKRLSGGDRLLVASAKRINRGRSAEGCSESTWTPMPSSAYTTFSLMDLPDVLPLEILLRLPVKSAFKCKSLCKRCCSLISGYYSSSPSYTLMFHQEQYAEIRSRRVQVFSDHPLLCKLSDLDFSFLPFFPREINEENYEVELQHTLSFTKLEATCDNLLLCSFAGNMENRSVASSVIHYYICNVVSRQFVELPPAPAASSSLDKLIVVGFLGEEKGVGASLSVSSGGTCGGLSLSRYAVVRIQIAGYRGSCSEFEVLTFCSETDCWNVSSTTTYPRELHRFQFGSRLLAYKDSLHLLTGDCVIVFDPFKDREEFSRIIDLPWAGSTPRGYAPHCLGISGSCLRVAQLSLREDGYENPDAPALSIWELEDCGKGTWFLAFKVSLFDIFGDVMPPIIEKRSRRLILSCVHLGVVGFHRDDSDIVYLMAGLHVYWLNMRTMMKEALYKRHNYDPLCIYHEKIIFRDTAFQLVHRWSYNPSKGLSLGWP